MNVKLNLAMFCKDQSEANIMLFCVVYKKVYKLE